MTTLHITSSRCSANRPHVEQPALQERIRHEGIQALCADQDLCAALAETVQACVQEGITTVHESKPQRPSRAQQDKSRASRVQGAAGQTSNSSAHSAEKMQTRFFTDKSQSTKSTAQAATSVAATTSNPDVEMPSPCRDMQPLIAEAPSGDCFPGSVSVTASHDSASERPITHRLDGGDVIAPPVLLSQRVSRERSQSNGAAAGKRPAKGAKTATKRRC